jgi:HlyD family secretion protein
MKRKGKAIYGLLSVALLICLGINIKGYFRETKNIKYKFADITRGDIEKTISSIGPLSPVIKVEVGTQISGTIKKVYVDYNDIVKKDQLLAELDTDLLVTAVLNAKAMKERQEAELLKAQADYDKNLSLCKKNIIPKLEFQHLETVLLSQRASLKSAAATLQRETRNLEYAKILSPIDGIVISKNVEEGQTCAANFQTPTLFVIAKDLSQMEILASVDENDIGLIKPNQKVRFEVHTYSGKTFEGIVKKIRLGPKLEANVVNYTVVVDVMNSENLLLPGMTANVDFIIGEKRNVLKTSKLAFSFRPNQEDNLFAQKKIGVKENNLLEKVKDNIKDSDSTSGQLWHLNDSGELTVEYVQTGLSDDSSTEIVNARHLKEGMHVISGVVKPEQEKSTKKSSNQMFMGGPGPGSGGPPPPPG